MINIGYRPILWHVMKYYAFYGHKEFILCLGYKADMIKDYFLNYSECLSNDFVLMHGGKKLDLLASDIQDWKITFIDTGIAASIGQRLKAVEEYIEEDEIFLANYSDGLSDLPLPDHVSHFTENRTVASFLSVKPIQTYHVVSIEDDFVSEIRHVSQSGIWMNAGYFIFRKDIFKYIQDGEDLVNEPFQRLIQERQLLTYKYRGFFRCTDTFKEKQDLDDMQRRGDTPWEVWKSPRKRPRASLINA